MAALDDNTHTKALKPVADWFTNSVDRKVFNCFCDSLLKAVDRFVWFWAGNWLELCLEQIIQRIQVRTTTCLVLRTDKMWQIALKPGLSSSTLMGWHRILLKNPALLFKYFHIQRFNRFFQHLLIYQSGRFYALLTKMDASKTVSPIDSQPDHHVSRMVSAPDTRHFLSNFDGCPHVHTVILFIKGRLNIENFSTVKRISWQAALHGLGWHFILCKNNLYFFNSGFMNASMYVEDIPLIYIMPEIPFVGAE